MSEAEADSETLAFQLERARATRARFARERHAATVNKMKEMASHRTSYSVSAEGYTTFESSAQIPATNENTGRHFGDTDAIEDGGAHDTSLADLDASFETFVSSEEDSTFADERTIGSGHSVDSESYTSFSKDIGNTTTSTHDMSHNMSHISHGSTMCSEEPVSEDDYERDETLQFVYSSLGDTVGELFEFCVMGEVRPITKKTKVEKVRKTLRRKNKEMAKQKPVLPYSASQRKAVEEMFGPATSGRNSEKGEASVSGGIKDDFSPLNVPSYDYDTSQPRTSVSGVLKDDFSPHKNVPSYDYDTSQKSRTWESILAPASSSSNRNKEAASSSDGLEDDSSTHTVPPSPSRPVFFDESETSPQASGTIDCSTQSTESSCAPQHQVQPLPPVSSQNSMLPVSDPSPNILSRRQRSKIAKQMQRRKYGHTSTVPDDSPPEIRGEEQRPPKDDSPPPVSTDDSPPPVPKDDSPPPVHKDDSPPPVHKRPQWEHFTALSDKIAKNAKPDQRDDTLPFDETVEADTFDDPNYLSTRKGHKVDMSTSSLAFDVSAIKCTNSGDEADQRSILIPTSPAKVRPSFEADMGDTATPRTTNRSFTAANTSGGKWISPSVSTTFEPPLTKSAPQKPHTAATQWSAGPGTVRKKLFIELDQAKGMPNVSHTTDVTGASADTSGTSSFGFESPLSTPATDTTWAAPGIFKSQPAHDDTNTTGEESTTFDFDLSPDWEFVESSFF
jgi:hypothetical protein